VISLQKADSVLVLINAREAKKGFFAVKPRGFR
jgi:hypothetical protein